MSCRSQPTVTALVTLVEDLRLPGHHQRKITVKERGRYSLILLLNLSACLTVHVSPVRGQRLKEVLHLHEFRRESSELADWMNQQRQTAESQDLGNDYQHVQVTSAYRSADTLLSVYICAYK